MTQLKNDIIKFKGKNGYNGNKIIKSNFIDFLNPPIKKNSNSKLILKNNSFNKKKIKIDVKINDKTKKISSSASRKCILDNSNFNKLDIIKSMKEIKINKKEIINKNQKQYDDYELNELEYIEATIYDKRSLFQIYWSILKREHLLIFTFFNCNDYNLLSIKLSRFIF